MMNILGLNFLSNFIPFFHHWVMKVNRASNFTQRQKFKDTFAHIILYYMLKDLDEQYSHDLQNYCKSSKLFKQILDAVEYRKCKSFGSMALTLHHLIWKTLKATVRYPQMPMVIILLLESNLKILRNLPVVTTFDCMVTSPETITH